MQAAGGTDTSALQTTLEEKCCEDNAFPLIVTSRALLAPLNHKVQCGTSFGFSQEINF